MLGNSKDDKLEKLLKITDITDEEFEKLDWKGKQNYFKAKNKLCKIFYKGKGAYVKKKVSK